MFSPTTHRNARLTCEKEWFKDVQGIILTFFVCTVFDKFLSHWPSLSAFCPFGHIKSNEACERHCSYRTLQLPFPVEVWTSTLNLQCRRSCLEGNGSLQNLTHARNAGVTVLLSAVMLFRIDSVLDKSTHTQCKEKQKHGNYIWKYENMQYFRLAPPAMHRRRATKGNAGHLASMRLPNSKHKSCSVSRIN